MWLEPSDEPRTPSSARVARREQLFRESVVERCRRAARTMSALVSTHQPEPMAGGGWASVTRLAEVVDLSPAAMIDAYRSGLVPVTRSGRLGWASHETRTVVVLRELAEEGRGDASPGKAFRVTFDHDFEGVVKACAGPRGRSERLVLIPPALMHAFAALNDLGRAHSFEVWSERGALVAGGFGVAVGRAFISEAVFGESQLAIDLGLANLDRNLRARGFLVHERPLPRSGPAARACRTVPRETVYRLLQNTVGEDGELDESPCRKRVENELA